MMGECGRSPSKVSAAPQALQALLSAKIEAAQPRLEGRAVLAGPSHALLSTPHISHMGWKRSAAAGLQNPLLCLAVGTLLGLLLASAGSSGFQGECIALWTECSEYQPSARLPQLPPPPPLPPSPVAAC